MYFKSKLKRNIWLGSFVKYFSDLILCSIITWCIGGGVLEAFLFFILLEVSLFIVFLFRSIVMLIFNSYAYKEVLICEFMKELKYNKFPEPNDLEVSVLDYLKRVALGEKNADSKFVAAYYIGYLECYKLSFQTLYFLTMTQAFEEAILKYKEQLAEENKQDIIKN